MKRLKVDGAGMYAAASIWGTWVLIINSIKLPGYFLTCITSFSGFLALLAVILKQGQRQMFLRVAKTRSLIRIVTIVALCGATQNALLMVAFSIAITNGGSAFLSVLRATSGIITPVMAIFVAKQERFSPKYLWCGLVSLVGGALIFSEGGINLGSNLSYLWIGMTSIVIGCLYSIRQKEMAVEMERSGQNPLNVIAWQSLLTSLFILPLCLGYFVVNRNNLTTSLIPEMGFIAIWGLTHVALAFILRLEALKTINAQQSVIIGYLEYIIAIFMSFLFFGDKINLSFIIGTVLIIGSAIAASIQPAPKESFVISYAPQQADK